MNGPQKTLPGAQGLTFHLRVSRRRKSVGLTVTDTGELLVHAPKSMSLKAIYKVIDKNRAWIEKKQAERREAWARLEKGKVYYQGRALTLKLVKAGPAGVRLSGGVLVMTLETNPPDPWPLLLDWYHREAEVLLNERVCHFAARMGLAPPPLELRNWRRRWGECHSDGRLRFNWRLVLLPPESLDYLVVHELAHLVVSGHPPRFWQEVGKYLADYADRRRWLRLYGSPFLLWKFEPEETRLLR